LEKPQTPPKVRVNDNTDSLLFAPSRRGIGGGNNRFLGRKFMTAMTAQAMTAKVGETLGTSEWLLVDQEMINKFADATGDHQFIHVNEEMAKMTPFGGTIAHGFLTLSLFPVLMAKSDCPRVEGVKMGVNYGGNKVRFLAPVRSGKKIRGHFKLLELEEKRPGQWQQTLEFSVEIEGEDKPALIAEWISQFFV
jgi:acyl dehydratase